MTYDEVVQMVEAVGNDRTRKIYIGHGAREPLFGVTIKDLKPIAKKLMNVQDMALRLFDSGNYDLMYLAGMIVNPKLMTEAQFESWMDQAYCYMIGDFTVSIVLCESELAEQLADKWIKSGDEMRMSAGYNTYCWMLGNQKDEKFNRDKLKGMLEAVIETIHDAPNRARYAMNAFVMTLAISYVPLHEEAVAAAEKIGQIEVNVGKTKCKVPLATEYIEKTKQQGRIGFKRKSVRC